MTGMPSMALNISRKSPFWAAPSFSGLEHLEEVALLSSTELLDGVGLDGLVVSEDEVLDELLALAEEHVLGTAEADAGGAVVLGELRVGRVVGVGADADHAAAVGVETDLVSRGWSGGRHRAPDGRGRPRRG